MRKSFSVLEKEKRDKKTKRDRVFDICTVSLLCVLGWACGRVRTRACVDAFRLIY